MEILLFIDRTLFALIFGLPRQPAFELIALVLSGVGSYGIIWFANGWYLLVREEQKSKWFFLPLSLAIVSGTFLTNAVLKPFFARMRPTDVLGITTFFEIGEQYSFPSGHTVVAFAAATVLSFFEPKMRKGFYLLATAIGFSRIYLGRHYPSDVLAGAVLGVIIGYAALRFTKFLVPDAFIRSGKHKKVLLGENRSGN